MVIASDTLRLDEPSTLFATHALHYGSVKYSPPRQFTDTMLADVVSVSRELVAQIY